MRKSFNFQELLKYIEENKIFSCKMETNRGHSCNSLGELLIDMCNDYSDCHLFEEITKMGYFVDIEGMTFEEALAEYRAYNDTKFDVYIDGKLRYTESLSYILAGKTGRECWEIINEAEFFIA